MKKLFTLLILLIPLSLMAQETRQIKGTILDKADGSALPGATIFIAPSQKQAADYSPQGAVAGLDGKFTFTFPTSVTELVVSFLGYESITIKVDSRTNYKFYLEPRSEGLEDIVVTGYQKIEKRRLTSSIATIDMEEINRAGVSSVDQMLEGQLAGVTSMATTGAPGAGSKIQIRSTVTLTGTSDPLWVLDGMPLEGNQIPKDWDTNEGIDQLYNMSIAGLDPNDIANINFLKDAGATSIYGPRAANGVIVITTKRGNINQPLRVNASATMFVTTRPNFNKLNMLNASEKVDLELQLAANGRIDTYKGFGGVGRIINDEQRQILIDNGAKAGFAMLPGDVQNSINNLRQNGTDWNKEIFQTAINQQYNVNISGGGQKTAYYFSGGYYKEDGTAKGTGFERLNLNIKTDWNILTNLKFGASLFVGQNTTTSYLTDKYSFMNPIGYSRNVNPYFSAYDEKGNYQYDPEVVAVAGSEYVLKYNFLEERANTSHELKNRNINAIFDLEYKPINGLNIYTQFGIQSEDVSLAQEANSNTYYRRWYAEQSKVDKVIYLPDGGVIQNEKRDLSQYIWKLQAQYGRTFNRHEFDVMAGVELRANETDIVATKGFGYDSRTLVTIPISFPDTESGRNRASSDLFNPYKKSYAENKYASYFGTASYTYDNRYTVFASLRYDGTNLFGVDPKYKYLPIWSISGAWNINRESFLKEQDWLNTLRLRVSYGIQGNVDRETSPYIIGRWQRGNYWGEQEDRILVEGPPNQNLKWEMTHSWNVGLDFSVLNNRINTTFEYYHRRSKDLITSQEIPLENGFYAVNTNYGEIVGRGIEFTLRTVNVKTREFSWSTQFNIARNKSRVEKIFHDDISWYPSLEGQHPYSIFAFKTAGLDDNGIPMMWKDGEKVSLKDFVNLRIEEVEIFPGWNEETLVMDGNVVDIRKHMVNMGNNEPKFSGGFNNYFKYKNFDLSISTNFVIGRTVRETPFYNPTAMNPGQNYSKKIWDVWSPENPNGKYPTLTGISREDGSSWGGAAVSEYDEYRLMYHIFDNFGSSNFVFNNLDIWVKKVSYLRVNSIRFGYTLPEAVSKKLRMQNLRLSFEARNPFVIATNYKGYFDPETYGNYKAQPVPRIFSFGINVTF